MGRLDPPRLVGSPREIQWRVTIQRDGAGRLYYRIGMKYAPHDLKIGPAAYGFVVDRRYESVDDKNRRRTSSITSAV